MPTQITINIKIHLLKKQHFCHIYKATLGTVLIESELNRKILNVFQMGAEWVGC